MAARQGREIAIDAEAEITLGLLEAVHENEQLTQRTAAHQLGIALGLTNAYLKRCIKKGLIKVKQIPPNRYAYYLTPKGFTEKSRLTADYLSYSFTFFRRARGDCGALMEECKRRGWRRVALCGVSELAEIATLCAREQEVEIVGLLDRARAEEGLDRFVGYPVVSFLMELERPDAVIVTDLAGAQATFEGLAGLVPDERLLVPGCLRVRRGAHGAESAP